MRRPSRAQVLAVLPSWLVEKVPRDHMEPDEAFGRRRRVVSGVTAAGAALLGVSLSTKPGSWQFYATSGGVATTWVVGGFASGPLHLGHMQTRDEQLRRPVLTPVVTGIVAFGVFYGCALVVRQIPVLDRAISSVLTYADEGDDRLVLLTTLANGAAEEVFFRGALYAAIGQEHPVALSTAAYALATVTTRNPALVLAATVMGTLFAAQRRASGGIQAPVLTHLTWSTLMLRYLPPLFRDIVLGMTTETADPVRTPARTPALRGLVAALTASLLFAVNGTVSKTVLESGVSSLRLVELRSLGAALCLMAAVAVLRPQALRVAPRELAFLTVAGVVGIGLVQWLYFVAIGRLPVGIALLLEYLAPVLVVVWVRFVRGEQVRRRLWAALALSVSGLVVVGEVWQGLRLDGLGVLAGLGAAVSLAAYYLTSERGLGRRDPLSLAAWTFTAAAVFWSVLQPWWTFPWGDLAREVAVPGPLPEAVVPAWVLVGWVVVLGTIVPYGLILLALASLGSARTGLLGMAEPVLAGAVAWVVLGEALSGVQLVGAVVVLTGILLAETARQSHPHVDPVPEGVVPCAVPEPA